MKIKELIRKLKDYPEEYEVIISHHRWERFPRYLKDKKVFDPNFIIQWECDYNKKIYLS